MLKQAASEAKQNKDICIVVANESMARSIKNNPIIAEYVNSGLIQIIGPKISSVIGRRYDNYFIDNYVDEITDSATMSAFRKEIKHRKRCNNFKLEPQSAL